MSEDYNTFRKKVHSKFNTSDKFINSIIVKALNSKIKNKAKIIIGQANEVYDITITNNSHYILRISRADNRKLYLERWAIEKAKKIDLPVPEIILVDSGEDNGEKLDYSLETKINGRPLDEILKNSHDKKLVEKIISDAGAILSQIHTIKTNGFGDIDETGTSKFKNLKDSILDREKYKHIFIEAAKNSNLNPKAIDVMFKIFKSNAALLDNSTPVLIHNDFGPQHIMVEGSKISGILDWEVVRGGDPIQDIARWEFYYGHKLPTYLLLNGYTNKKIMDDNFETKLHLFKLYKELILIYYNNSTGNISGTEYDKKNIIKDLKYFGVKI